MKKYNWKKIVICLALSIVVAFLVALITKSLGLAGTDSGISSGDDVIWWSILNG
jgi:hypothetical protein